MTTSLSAALSSGPVVLDGGLATRLEERGHDLSSDLWSARLLADSPDEIAAAHRDYFQAGAQVAISSSYQASFEGFAALGIDRSGAETLLRRSVALADQARREAEGQRWVAASVGPYGAMLADGSEYRGDYGLTVDELRRWHRPRLQLLMQAVSDGLADVLAVETVPCAAEAEALLAEIDGSGIPAWISLTCADGRTRAGEPAERAFGLANGVDEIVAVGVNCCAATETAELIASAVAASGKPAVAYPNSGESWDGAARCWRGDPTFQPELVRGWLDAGARLVGGCCRVGPAAIETLAVGLRSGRKRGTNGSHD